jgi:hypothetical protein
VLTTTTLGFVVHISNVHFDIEDALEQIAHPTPYAHLNLKTNAPFTIGCLKAWQMLV